MGRRRDPSTSTEEDIEANESLLIDEESEVEDETVTGSSDDSSGSHECLEEHEEDPDTPHGTREEYGEESHEDNTHESTEELGDSEVVASDERTEGMVLEGDADVEGGDDVEGDGGGEGHQSVEDPDDEDEEFHGFSVDRQISTFHRICEAIGTAYTGFPRHNSRNHGLGDTQEEEQNVDDGNKNGNDYEENKEDELCESSNTFGYDFTCLDDEFAAIYRAQLESLKTMYSERSGLLGHTNDQSTGGNDNQQDSSMKSDENGEQTNNETVHEVNQGSDHEVNQEVIGEVGGEDVRESVSASFDAQASGSGESGSGMSWRSRTLNKYREENATLLAKISDVEATMARMDRIHYDKMARIEYRMETVKSFCEFRRKYETRELMWQNTFLNHNLSQTKDDLKHLRERYVGLKNIIQNKTMKLATDNHPLTKCERIVSKIRSELVKLSASKEVLEQAKNNLSVKKAEFRFLEASASALVQNKDEDFWKNTLTKAQEKDSKLKAYFAFLSDAVDDDEDDLLATPRAMTKSIRIQVKQLLMEFDKALKINNDKLPDGVLPKFSRRFKRIGQLCSDLTEIINDNVDEFEEMFVRLCSILETKPEEAIASTSD